MIEQLETEILVVGAGAGGTAAALQGARRGRRVILVGEFPWLGGMLTSAGVAAPDGNELAAWQTGMWGQFLRVLKQRQPEGLDHGWVSLFTFDPALGAEIFAEWAAELPSLTWIPNQAPLEVLKRGDRVLGVRFPDYEIRAQITLDGTELGDLLALGEIPHRWGWDWGADYDEPSAPKEPNQITQTYPVQSPTWVFLLQDYGAESAPKLDPRPCSNSALFAGAWEKYGPEKFRNYGRLPQNRYMINWPLAGNDYGRDLNRLLTPERGTFLQEAYDHSYHFACFLQENFGRRWGLASPVFPHSNRHPAFALHPYFRESRRLLGQVTVTEQDLLPQGETAPLPLENQKIASIAIGNYANDHHYPGFEFPLAPKSRRWGGRWTGTPFTVPYGALVPRSTLGFLVCEKNISVSHIANGSTRLQPLVMNLGQACGLAAALCVERHCDPQDLPVEVLQEQLLTDPQAPAAVIPFYDLPPDHPDWLNQQRRVLDAPETYPTSGACEAKACFLPSSAPTYSGTFFCKGEQDYRFSFQLGNRSQSACLITERPEVDQKLKTLRSGQRLTLQGRYNGAGSWLVVETI